MKEIIISIGILFLFILFLIPESIELSINWIIENITFKNLNIHKHSWKYEKKEIKVEDKWERDIITEVSFRKCTKCGQKQYRTMLPSCNGYDSNKWINIQGELKLTNKN